MKEMTHVAWCMFLIVVVVVAAAVETIVPLCGSSSTPYYERGGQRAGPCSSFPTRCSVTNGSCLLTDVGPELDSDPTLIVKAVLPPKTGSISVEGTFTLSCRTSWSGAGFYVASEDPRGLEVLNSRFAVMISDTSYGPACPIPGYDPGFCTYHGKADLWTGYDNRQYIMGATPVCGKRVQVKIQMLNSTLSVIVTSLTDRNIPAVRYSRSSTFPLVPGTTIVVYPACGGWWTGNSCALQDAWLKLNISTAANSTATNPPVRKPDLTPVAAVAVVPLLVLLCVFRKKICASAPTSFSPSSRPLPHWKWNTANSEPKALSAPAPTSSSPCSGRLQTTANREPFPEAPSAFAYSMTTIVVISVSAEGNS